jgi:hypothetical protein
MQSYCGFIRRENWSSCLVFVLKANMSLRSIFFVLKRTCQRWNVSPFQKSTVLAPKIDPSRLQTHNFTSSNSRHSSMAQPLKLVAAGWFFKGAMTWFLGGGKFWYIYGISHGVEVRECDPCTRDHHSTVAPLYWNCFKMFPLETWW